MSNKYWTNKTDKEDIIAAADFNNAFGNIASDIEKFDKVAEEIGELKGDLGKLIVKSPNIFDKSKAKKGIYYTVGVGEGPYEKTNAAYFGAIVEVNPNTTYTIKVKGYYTYFLDENRIRTGGIQGDASLSSLTVTTTNSTRYIVFSSSIETLNTNMIVEGEKVPTEFIPYGVQYGEVLNEMNEKISANTSAIENIGIEEIYHVGVDKEYTKFYDCLKALAGNKKKKTIYVHAGTYDLFDEIGGVDFINSIQSGVGWRDVNTFIPPNTKIIGIGNVVFNYMPTSEQATVLSAGLISPINCMYSVEIENITVNAQNCRYCIHDESSGWDVFDNTIHKYKNVRAIFYDGGVVGSPSGIAFAGGFSSNVVFDFDNCYFETKRTSGGAFYLHNWKSIGTNGSLISLKNCVLLNLSDNSIALQLGNMHNNTILTENVVSVDNCYLKGKISVIKVSSGDTSNTFNVKALKSASSVGVDSSLMNEFVPQIFN